MSLDAHAGPGATAHTIPVNMYRAPHAVVVVAVAPAVTADDVTVQRTGSRLRITARLRNAPQREYLIHEWTYGDYERELDLPAGFEGDLEASLVNGQLVVRAMAGTSPDPTATLSVTPAPRHGRA